MITVKQAAARLGRDPETVRRWIRSGRLPAKKIGLQLMIEESDLPCETTDLPSAWRRTATGEPMPDLVAAVRRSRAGR